ncbi:MAG: hypothetical protein ACPGCM_00495 [Alteromonas oceani]
MMIYVPKVVNVETDFESDTTVTIDEIRFDIECLKVTVGSKSWSATVNFDAIHGFRVLDEGDLGEFWSQCNLKTGWCFEVLAGGWNDLENTRKHYVTGKLYQPKEFLIIGLNECVSVLTFEQPKVVEA